MPDITTQPSAVLFDLDGTLIDTAPDFIWCLNTQRARHGLAPMDAARIRGTVSNGARALVELGFGLTPDMPDYKAIHSELLDIYLDHLAVDTVLFPGMEEVLAHLEQQQIPWGIVTNKPRRFTEPLLVGLNLDRRCQVTVCPDDVAQRKPHPESLLKAAKTIQAVPEKAFYVGDHERDIVAGRAAAMKTVAARYGYIADPLEIPGWQADHIIDHGNELLALIQSP